MNNILISSNSSAENNEFVSLLEKTTCLIQADASRKENEYLDLGGTKLEKKVYDFMVEVSKGTKFDKSIELVSGQKFPDIVAKKYYGVEVKSTKANKWTSVGSSIAEGTRVDGVERIYMFFGKICKPVEFVYKPYQECLSDVVVTHSPRYLINMALPEGGTIFDKMKMGYDVLRKQSDPIKKVLEYYKQNLKPGDSFWWLDKGTNNLIIKAWNNLSMEEKVEYTVKGYCYFPELVGKRIDKFNKYAVWLSIHQGIVCPNVRDIFTAGGQGQYIFNSKLYNRIPRIIINLINNLPEIKKIIKETEYSELKEYWGAFDEDKRYEQWIELIKKFSATTIHNNIPIAKIIEECFFI